MAHVVTAYIFMAYTVMACTVMANICDDVYGHGRMQLWPTSGCTPSLAAYIIMVYVVVAYAVMACAVMAHAVMAYLGLFSIIGGRCSTCR